MENINQTWFQFPSDTDFTYHNIPFGVFSTKKDPEDARPATRVGDYLIDLRELEINNLLIGEQYKSLNRKIFQSRTLNDFMSLTRSDWREVRKTIQQLLHLGSELDKNLELRKKLFFHINDIIMHLPAHIQDYTDFYSSKNHAYNIGVMFRGKDNALQPNWTHLPVGYHGRASTVVVSGTSIHRPRGQTKAPTAEKPSFTECKRLDFELEIGAFIGGKPNKLGEPINVNEAENRIFGIVLMNDWSARDIQNWEYVPLGPFLAKNFGTTISPWVVTLDALESFKIDLPKQDPEPLPYLNEKKHCSYDIFLDVYLQPENAQNQDRITRSNFKYLYWSITQQLAHHSVTGCIMNPGDLLGSGTISGTEKHEFGSMIELSWSGQEKIQLSNGQERTFIQDGDTITMKGWAEKNGVRIGFGECSGKILPAHPENIYY